MTELLGELKVSLGDLGDLTLEDVRNHPSLTLLCSEVGLSVTVTVYGGMMGESSLIHCGDFIKYSDHQLTSMVS